MFSCRQLACLLVVTICLLFFNSAIANAQIWYVNDTATVGDSWCSAVGSALNNGLTPSTPKRTIASALLLAAAGDTICIDAGYYLECLTISNNNLWLLGVDSSTTVIYGVDSTPMTGGRGINFNQKTGIVVKDLQIRGTYQGCYVWFASDIHIENVACLYNSTAIEIVYSPGVIVTRSHIHDNHTGVSVTSDGDEVSNSVITDNPVNSIFVWGTANTFRDNVLGNGNSGFGIFSDAHENFFLRNQISGVYYGVAGGTGYGNVFIGNQCVNAINFAIEVDGESNTYIQNSLIGPRSFYLKAGARNNIFSKNNMSAGSVITADCGNPHDFGGNYWGSSDSVVVRSMLYSFWGLPLDDYSWLPFRLGMVDTNPAADTVAPCAPTGLQVVSAAYSCTVIWNPVTLNEEGAGGATDLAGYRVYRSTNRDTSNWGLPVAITGSGDTDYTDTAITTRCYYRVTAFDSHSPYENESWYSAIVVAVGDTTVPAVQFLSPADSADTEVLTVWIEGRITDVAETPVMVVLTTNDGFETGVVPAPDGKFNSKVTFSRAGLWLVTATCTDAFTNCGYDTLLINVRDTFTSVFLLNPANGLTTDLVPALSWGGDADTYRVEICRDSTFSVIVDSSTRQTTAYLSSSGLTTDTYYWRVVAWDAAGNYDTTPARSFYLRTIDSGVTTVYVFDGGDSTNPLSGIPGQALQSPAAAINCLNPANGYDTVIVYAPLGDGYRECLTLDTGMTLISYKALTGSDTAGGGDTWPLIKCNDYEIVTGANWARLKGFVVDGIDQTESGLYMRDVTGMDITDVQVRNCGYGAELRQATANSISNCIFTDNQFGGIYGYNAAHANRYIGNSIVATTDGSGIELSNCNDNFISGNNIHHNRWTGIYLSTGSRHTIVANSITHCGEFGMYIYRNDTNWVIANNIQNNQCGAFYLHTSNFNYLAQNQLDSNGGPEEDFCGINLGWLGTGNRIEKNNYSPAADRPVTQRAVYVHSSQATNPLQRNWWSSTDSLAVSRHMASPFGQDSPVFLPYRLGPVDTAPGADTVAPATPTALTLTGMVGSCRLTWSAPLTNEEGGAPLTDLSGYRIYRSAIADTGRGTILVGSTVAGVTVFDDTPPGGTNYYRVTAHDNHLPWENESWFSNPVFFAGDTTVPAVTITGPAAGAVLAVSRVLVQGVVTDMAETPSMVVLSTDEGLRLNVALTATGSFADTVTFRTNGIHRITISCTDAGGNTGSDTLDLTVNDTTVAITLLTPSGGHETFVSRPLFTWNGDADTYLFQVSRMPAFAVLTDSSYLTANSYQHGIGYLADTYYWRVIATDVVGNIITSDSRLFVIDTGVAVTLLNPPDCASSILARPQFTWMGNGTSYMFQLGTTPNLSVIIDSVVQVATACQPSPTLVPGTYYWRVIASDTYGNRDTSAIHQLQVELGDPGRTTVFVSDRGDSSYPKGGNPLTAYTSIQGAITALDPANGYDTVIVFSRAGGLAYAEKLTLDTGMTLISYRAYAGADTGGGPDTHPTVAYNFAVVTVADSCKVRGLIIDGLEGALSFGVRANPASSINLSELWISRCNFGMYLTGMVNSQIADCHILGPMGQGMFLENVRGNRITGNEVDGDGNSGYYLTGGDSNYFFNNRRVNGISGFALMNEHNTTFDSNLVYQTMDGGFWGSDVSGCTFSNNEIHHTSQAALNFSSSFTNNLIANNYCHDNAGVALQFYFYGGAGNIIRDNLAVNNDSGGIFCYQATAAQLLRNTLVNNGVYGIRLNGCSGDLVTDNTILATRGAGIQLITNSTNNSIMRNRISGSQGYGVSLTSSPGNYVALNEIDSSAAYSLYLNSASTITRNNVRPGQLNPDSGAFLISDPQLVVTRNYWGTAHGGVLTERFRGPGADSIARAPFRSSQIDTAAGADTVAPATPTGLTAVVDTDGIHLAWLAPVSDEEASAVPFAVTGYRLYRSVTADTDNWFGCGVAELATTAYCDTIADTHVPQFYRVTAYDAHSGAAGSFRNESWLSDTAVASNDTSVPHVTFLTPVDGAETTALTVAVAGLVDDAANTPSVAVLTTSAGHYAVLPLAANGAFSATVTFTETGIYQIAVSCTDVAKNAGRTVLTVRVDDSSVPRITLFTPAPGTETCVSSVIVSGRVDDVANTPSVAVLVTDEGYRANMAISTGGIFSASCPFTANGWRTVTVACTDIAGNCTQIVRQVRFDNVLTVSLAAPLDYSLLSETRPQFTWTGDGDTYLIEIARTGLMGLLIDSTISTGTAYQPTGGYPADTYYWRVTATDRAGNIRTSDTRILVITPAAISDLQLLAVAGDTEVKSRQVMQLSATLRSAGSLLYAGSTTINWYLSLNSSYDAGDTWLGAQTRMVALAAGAETTILHSITLPETMTINLYYLIGVLTAADSLSIRHEARTPGTVSVRVDNGFLPQVDGWGFSNYSGGYVGWNVFRMTFGTEQTEYPDGRHKPYADAYYNAIPHAFNGYCFGFAVSSVKLYGGALPPRADYSRTYDRPRDQNSLDLISSQHIFWYGEGAFIENRARHWATSPSLRDFFRQVSAGLNSSDTRGWFELEFQCGVYHSVAPYRIVHAADTTVESYDMYVYENNRPGDPGKKINLNLANGVWTYQNSPWGALSGGSNTIWVAPMSLAETYARIPGRYIEMYPGAEFVFFDNINNFSVNIAGQTAATYADSYLNSVSDSVVPLIVPGVDGDSMLAGMLVLGRAPYTIAAATRVTAAQPSHWRIFGNNKAIVLTTSSSGGADSIVVSETECRFLPERSSVAQWFIDHVQGEEERIFRVNDPSATAGKALAVSLADSTQLNIINLGDTRTLTIELERQTATGGTVRRLDPLVVPQRAEVELPNVGWTNLPTVNLTITTDLLCNGSIDSSAAIDAPQLVAGNVLALARETRADTAAFLLVTDSGDSLVVDIPVFNTRAGDYGDTLCLRLHFAGSDTGQRIGIRRVAPDSVTRQGLTDYADYLTTMFALTVSDSQGRDLGGTPANFSELELAYTFAPGRFTPGQAQQLRVFTFDEADSTWKEVGGATLNLALHTLMVRLPHLSIYGIFPAAGFAAVSANLNNVTVYPNPYIPDDGDPGNGIPFGAAGDGSGIYINGLVPGTIIRIYDIRGRLVDEMTVPAGTGAVQWDVRNKRGEDVASGVYIATFENGGERATRKIIVVR